MKNDTLQKILKDEGISIDENAAKRLAAFAALLHEWNRIHNLTGARTLADIYKNIADSLYPLAFVSFPKTLLDVGTGAGFPGLMLAIAMPNIEVMLAEPLKKRASFLKYAAIDLGLCNVAVEAKRVEQIAHEPFGLISSRAVTNTKLLLDLTQKVRDKKTAYLLYKGSRVFEEVQEVQHQLSYDIVQKNQRNYLYIKGCE